jgi:hypothetical protein
MPETLPQRILQPGERSRIPDHPHQLLPTCLPRTLHPLPRVHPLPIETHPRNLPLPRTSPSLSSTPSSPPSKPARRSRRTTMTPSSGSTPLPALRRLLSKSDLARKFLHRNRYPASSSHSSEHSTTTPWTNVATSAPSSARHRCHVCCQ